LFTRVNNLLSSITEFIDSIHYGSTSPSRIITLWGWFDLYCYKHLDIFRINHDITPSFHYLDFDIVPYNYPDVTDLGLIV